MKETLAEMKDYKNGKYKSNYRRLSHAQRFKEVAKLWKKHKEDAQNTEHQANVDAEDAVQARETVRKLNRHGRIPKKRQGGGKREASDSDTDSDDDMYRSRKKLKPKPQAAKPRAAKPKLLTAGRVTGLEKSRINRQLAQLRVELDALELLLQHLKAQTPKQTQRIRQVELQIRGKSSRFDDLQEELQVGWHAARRVEVGFDKRRA